MNPDGSEAHFSQGVQRTSCKRLPVLRMLSTFSTLAGRSQ